MDVALARKLRMAAYLEAEARAEADRLMAAAFDQGWSDRQIAAATGLSFDTVRMRRKRRGQKRLRNERKRPAIAARVRA